MGNESNPTLDKIRYYFVICPEHFLLLCVDRDMDGTSQCLEGVENEKEELHHLTTLLQKSLEVSKNTIKFEEITKLPQFSDRVHSL